jgi:hypothetical protein
MQLHDGLLPPLTHLGERMPGAIVGAIAPALQWRSAGRFAFCRVRAYGFPGR